MANINLLTPGRIGALDTPNRIMMAPMTRSRAHDDGVPSDLAVTYYVQRASAGLIITEGVAPVAVGRGYARTPSIHTPEQIAGWKRIADAVHAEGGRLFMQFMHVGRIAHSANRYTAEPPIAPSAVRAEGQMWTDAHGMQDFDMPRALETAEVAGVIQDFAQATRNALAAGFDGVELHAASGYLPMQFLSPHTNRRTDAYGGSIGNRIRFVVETLEAMIAAAGSSGRVGMKISPGIVFNDIQETDPVATLDTYTALVKAIDPLQLGYLHVLQSAFPNTFETLRPFVSVPFAAGGGFTFESGNAMLASGKADFIVFGKPFTSNPDLPIRFGKGAALTPFTPETFYTPGAKGYTDFPSL
jgi:N-ethylmaleimide reductase